MSNLLMTNDGRKIDSVALLTPQEYLEYRENIQPIQRHGYCPWRWWLQNTEPQKGEMALVVNESTKYYLSNSGKVIPKTPDMPQNGEIFPDSVYAVCYIRPALHMTDLKVGETIQFDDQTFTAISDQIALCDSDIGTCQYTKELDMEKATKYEFSEAKRRIEEWIWMYEAFKSQQEESKRKTYGGELFGPFANIKAQIHENEDGESFFILDEGDDFIEMESTVEPIKVCRYENMYEISSDWIKDRIITSSSVNIDKDDMAKFVFEHIPKETYQTLRYLIFIKDDEADFDELFDQLESITGYPLLEVHDFPHGDQLGITWTVDCCCVVHVGNIEKEIDRMVRDGDIDEWERAPETEIGIMTTIAHELRHLQQTDLFLQSDVVFLSDPEEDAEEFARQTMDQILGYSEPDLKI